MKQPLKDTQFTFKRYESKYLLNPAQYECFMQGASEHLVPDEYHLSNVLSVYYDTDDYRLIRESIEKPLYKEKLRIRSYGVPEPDGMVFVELKKKYKGVVYKRRVEMPAKQAEAWVNGKKQPLFESQITKEIDWFLKTNDVSPKAFIGCRRVSWVDKDEHELRITFDEQIKWRDYKLSVLNGDEGELLLKDGECLMEIKIPEAAPMWLARLLSDEEVFPTSFSKYGSCYSTELINKSQFADYL